VLNAFSNVFKIPELRSKVLWTLFYLAIFRLGSVIPLPGVNVAALGTLQEQYTGWLGLVSAFTGGALANSAIFSLGIMPYISSSIIFSLLTKIVPSLEALSKEGAAGQRKINQWTRYCTVPICILQAIFVCRMMANPANYGGLVLVSNPGIGWYLMAVLVLTAGGVLLIWVGEQITEYGVGNGISLLISVGIISQMPGSFSGIWLQRGAVVVAILFIVYCLVVAGVIIIVQGQRRIPVQQAKHTRGRRVYGGQRHFIPIRVNMAGVMPVIFAQSLLIFPTVILSWAGVGSWMGVTSFWYITLYVAMTFFFTFFWTSLMFQPKEMANNMKEHGSFIPGIRPGGRTAEYLEKIMVNVSVAGAAFLAALGVFPQIMAGVVGLGRGLTAFLGGTGLLIVVGVTLDFVQKVESHLLMRHYEGFMKKGRVRGRRWGGGGW
jgi:preprotein translocase subunit SecY